MIAERHPWLVKSSQWDERKHPRDKGKFSSSQGARGSEKPKTDIRHNPDLDAVFAEPAQANPQAKPSGDLRRNTALDEFMGIEGWNSPSKPDPAKVASDAAAKIGQQFAMGKPHKVKDFIAALRQHPPEVIQAICAKAGIVKTDTPRDVVGKFYKAFGGKVKVSFPKMPPPLPKRRAVPPPLPRRRRKGVHPWLVKRAQWDESKHPRGQAENAGEFVSVGGSRSKKKTDNPPSKRPTESDQGSSEGKYAEQARKIVNGKIKEVKQRAWTGQQNGKPISKDIAGAVGEEIVIQYLKSIGYDDAGHTSSLVGTAMNNLPFDLIHDHQLIEVKGGQVGSGEGIWALKYDGRFTKEQEAKFARMTPEKVKLAKKKINQAKVKAIHDRKKAFVDRLSKELGFKIKPGMMTVIIDHERKIADIYRFDQLHDRINWKSELAQNGYVTSVRYG